MGLLQCSISVDGRLGAPMRYRFAAEVERGDYGRTSIVDHTQAARLSAKQRLSTEYAVAH